MRYLVDDEKEKTAKCLTFQINRGPNGIAPLVIGINEETKVVVVRCYFGELVIDEQTMTLQEFCDKIYFPEECDE